MRALFTEKPIIFATIGTTFSGKSTFAKKFANLISISRVSVDEIHEGRGLPLLVVDETWSETYAKTHAEVIKQVKSGNSVIIDAPHHKKKYRTNIKKIADEQNCQLLFIYIHVSAEELTKRWRENDASQIRHHPKKDYVAEMLKKLEPPDESESYVVYEAGEDVDQWTERTFGAYGK